MNAGNVVRDGDHVLRPAGPQTEAVHDFLVHVRQRGFEGAPLPIGVENGRERLTFIAGDVPATPYPSWVQSDETLVSIAELVRSFHDAARGFDATRQPWDETLSDPLGGTIVCHNDIEFGNVVFEHGRAVGLIDFEFAAPGRPVYDLAHFARLCVPIEDDFDQRRLGWDDAARPERLRLIADSYGLGDAARLELLGTIDAALDSIEQVARRSMASGDPAVRSWVERTGGIEKYDRRRRWWNQHRAEFAAVMR